MKIIKILFITLIIIDGNYDNIDHYWSIETPLSLSFFIDAIILSLEMQCECHNETRTVGELPILVGWLKTPLAFSSITSRCTGTISSITSITYSTCSITGITCSITGITQKWLMTPTIIQIVILMIVLPTKLDWWHPPGNEEGSPPQTGPCHFPPFNFIIKIMTMKTIS